MSVEVNRLRRFLKGATLFGFSPHELVTLTRSFASKKQMKEIYKTTKAMFSPGNVEHY
jgi:hypothetical protein